LADFNNFWHATSGKYLTQMIVVLATSLILSLHYLVKCRSHSLAIHNNKFILDSAHFGSKMIN